MLSKRLRFRHVHLDYHTSEKIPHVAADFDAEVFADTLVRAHVNSINCFARCHHGWIYYDSEKYSELIHPNLENKNLLKEQIEACHARGIRVPIYVTVQWDHRVANEHPEWVCKKLDGSVDDADPDRPGFYRYLCVNTPYTDFLKELSVDIIENLEVDGLWYDIVQPRSCVCENCKKRMLDKGLDPTNPDDILLNGQEVLDAFKLEMSEFVRQYNKDYDIFYNAGHVGPYIRKSLDAYSHLELESLASAFWGYEHFPMTIRYARTLGKDCLGMTGKFHTAWGDFHSFKNPAALEYECFRAMAFNAKICVGDQLPPNGRICPHTYKLIGDVYESVEQKEPWCEDATPVTEIALLHPEEFEEYDFMLGLPSSLSGAVRMLSEMAMQFDVVDTQADLAKYKMLILPDCIPVNKALAKKLSSFVKSGGTIIASFESGVDPASGEFQGLFGVQKTGNDPAEGKDGYQPRQYDHKHSHIDYLMPNEVIGKTLPATEHVMYLRSLDVSVKSKAEVLAEVIKPYFDRTEDGFCSHLQTPSSGETARPAVVRNGSVIYFSHPVFSNYQANAPLWCKKIVQDAIALLLAKPLVRHNGPSFLTVTLNEQPQQNRYVLHALNYIPEKRSETMESIEDVIATANITFTVRIDKKVSSVQAVPQGKPLLFGQKGDEIRFVLDTLQGHQIIEIQYES